MKNADTTPETFDVLALRALPGGRELLQGVPDRACAFIAGGAVRVLREHPTAARGDVYALSHVLWENVRNIVIDDAAHNVEWGLLQGPSMLTLTVLDAVLHVLLDAGSLRDTLLRQRAAIDKELEKLSRPHTATSAENGRR